MSMSNILATRNVRHKDTLNVKLYIYIQREIEREINIYIDNDKVIEKKE